jgi:hypothetical protein
MLPAIRELAAFLQHELFRGFPVIKRVADANIKLDVTLPGNRMRYAS